MPSKRSVFLSFFIILFYGFFIAKPVFSEVKWWTRCIGQFTSCKQFCERAGASGRCVSNTECGGTGNKCDEPIASGFCNINSNIQCCCAGQFGTIAAYVWEDVNTDGVRQLSEGRDGATVSLDNTRNSITKYKGWYFFDKVTIGTHVLRLTGLPSGYEIGDRSEVFVSVDLSENWAGNFRIKKITGSSSSSSISSSSSSSSISSSSSSSSSSTSSSSSSSSSSPNRKKLMFKGIFPNIDPSVLVIPQVQVEVGADNSVIVPLSKVGNYFQTNSPITLDVEAGKPYTVSIKAGVTLRRLFNNVIFSQEEVLDCVTESAVSNCGELKTALPAKQFYSGDTDGFNKQSDSLGKVDSIDLQVLSGLYGSTNQKADFNYDGAVDILDLDILGRNYGLQGE